MNWSNGFCVGTFGAILFLFASESVAVEKGFDESMSLAMHALRDGKNDEAIAEFTVAMKAKPDCLDAHKGRIIALTRTKQFDKAFADADALEKLDKAEATV